MHGIQVFFATSLFVFHLVQVKSHYQSAADMRGFAAAESQVVPKSFGLKYDPPSIALVYEMDGKLRKRTMPVRKVQATSDPSALATQLTQTHQSLLGPDVVSHEQIVRLMTKLVQHAAKAPPAPAPGAPAPAAAAPVAASATGALAAGGDSGTDGDDLNKVSAEELAARKAAMEVDFERNRVKPGDAAFRHDKRIEFAPAEESNEWDDELEDFSSEEEEDPLKALLDELP